MSASPDGPERIPTDQLVKDFLHGQNLEQIGRVDEAIPLYEQAVSAHFDAAGPYDRLIFIFQGRREYREVIRVARAALAAVHTYDAKRLWYEQQISGAEGSMGAPPQPLPR